MYLVPAKDAKMEGEKFWDEKGIHDAKFPSGGERKVGKLLGSKFDG